MNHKAPIQYRDFWDIPRIFIVEHQGHNFLFDCPFDEELEDYQNEYRIYLLPMLAPDDFAGSWGNLSRKAVSYLGEIPIGRVHFDASKRKEMNADLLEELIAHLSKPKQVVG
jgi:hypothetical protein